MPVTHTTEIDGQEISVEVPDEVITSAGYVPKDDYVPKSFHEKEIGRVGERFRGEARDAIRSELTSDEAFIKSVLEKHGKKGGEVDIDAAYQKWEAEKLQPAIEDRNSLLSFVKAAEIARTAPENVNEAFLKSDKGRDFLRSLFEARLERDGDRFIALHADGKTRLPGSDGSYAGAEALWEEMKADASLGFLFTERPRNGKGSDPSPGSGGPAKKSVDEMSTEEIAAFIRTHGKAEFDKLMTS